MFRLFFILICFNSITLKAQYGTDFKVNILPIVLSGYGFSIEQKVHKNYGFEIGITQFKRISINLEQPFGRIEDPFSERHIYTNLFREITVTPNHLLQFGSQFNFYKRIKFSDDFINEYRTIKMMDPPSNVLFVTSILLGYKWQFLSKWSAHIQLGYNLRNNTETQSAFSIAIGYKFNEYSKKVFSFDEKI